MIDYGSVQMNHEISRVNSWPMWFFWDISRSKRFLKSTTVSDVTVSSVSEFHALTIRIGRELVEIFVETRILSSFQLCPLCLLRLWT